MRYKGYLIEEAASKAELRNVVEGLMEEGWIPLGGLTIACDLDGVIVYCQAMILPDNRETPRP